LATCGSLLPGLPADFYARAGRRARERGARFVPDCDGEALAAAAPEADLLVPNDREAARLLGRPVHGTASAMAAPRALLARYQPVERAVVTLGAEGAVAADGDGAWHARAVPPSPEAAARLASASAVGAGDAFLAALLLALDGGATTPEALADAVAAGTAVLLSEGAALLRREDAMEVRAWVEVRSET
ncbi:MAG: PfkB family carbohydrate kinase, partial [Longimicrobiales bacterium]|nr:PfkB family carbohydrate kinase [Longimicrobiales bacterium]